MSTGDRKTGLSAQRAGWVFDCGERYWKNARHHIAALPLATSLLPESSGRLARVALPDWAQDLGIEGALLVDGAAVVDGEGPDWSRCDWLAAAWHFLTGAVERARERAHGPIHSYVFRLSGCDARQFDRAWVNRIFLFLRRWAARHVQADEDRLFGPLPDTEIVLTHDVDAIRKTPEIRLKQSAFHAWNGARMAMRGEVAKAAGALAQGTRFLVTGADLATFAEIRKLEEAAGLRSLLHFYAGPPGLERGSPLRVLLDPAYDILAPAMRAELRALADGGWQIGLHQSTRAWADAGAMRVERERLEAAAGAAVSACRQHWLLFSWADTWRAQEAAGLKRDSTLGFNDRSGFRNGAALEIQPWNFSREQPYAVRALPMVFMDSHFYDYQVLPDAERYDAMSGWLAEIRAVRGQATVNWHTHTITDAYGWGAGYRQLLQLLG